LEKSDAVIFTIGTLLDTSVTKNAEKGAPGTYEHMNRDTAISIGNCLNEIKGKRFVYISGSSSPPFMPRYLSTKMEAEEHLRSLSDIKTIALRPGFVYSATERVW
jgi:nucleoside-diphosphate-sugar epimerase